MTTISTIKIDDRESNIGSVGSIIKGHLQIALKLLQL